MKVPATTLLCTVLLLILIGESARAETLGLREPTFSATSKAPLLVISPIPFADDFLARTQIGRKVWQALIVKTAAANDLPQDFLMRLVAQESGFDPSSISKAGALGIAQFMPATAMQVGLRDPFDPFEAIPAAAKHVRDLRARFGNLGLAAAAYNAGPDRVTAWLAGRGELPAETLNYVRAVTGRDADDWAPKGFLSFGVDLSIQLARAPAVSRERNTRNNKTTSTASLCQSINSASSRCIVQQRY